MKRLLPFIALAMVFSSCDSPRQVGGTFAGAGLGAVMGSSIGGIAGGYRGRDVGRVVGMVTGGVVGSLLTSEAGGQVDDIYYAPRKEAYSSVYEEANGTDDEVCYFPIQVQHVKFIDSNKDRAMNIGETCKIIFELVNTGAQSVYDVVPYLTESVGKGCLTISPSQRIAMIGPGGVMRYTASVKVNKKIKEGKIRFRIAISAQGFDSKVLRDFTIPFAK